jgi:NAD(P)-dependent dehydrogenase (short-subunit alcohol dehydrogenase family)
MSQTSDSEYKGRVAFITGGGRGFGKAFGKALSERGASVVLADVDVAAAEAAARELGAGGAQVLPVACDVSSEDQVAAAMERTVGAFGGLDILINNAGLHSHAYNEPLTVSGVAKLRRLFDVNVMGVIICSLAARAALAGRPGASIVNLSSSAAYGCPTGYGVSKLAVRGLTITLARDLKDDGIRVNAIAPGMIFTDTIRAELPPATVANVKARQIMDREGEEKDIVDMMLFLTSSNASFITGETMRVSGGLALWT